MLRNTVFMALLIPLMNAAPVTIGDATIYLYKYGYLQPASFVSNNVEDDSTEEEEEEDEWSVGVKKFQEMAGIEATGDLDEATLREMASPRCGVPDIAMSLSKTSKPLSLAWTKRALTFSIDNFWKAKNGMSENSIRKAIRHSFNVFEDIIPLKFSEVDAGTGDIRLGFYGKVHGDNNDFKGKGDLAHAFPPPIGHIHFNEEENWTIMNERNLPANAEDFLTTTIHEIGHALGFRYHSNNKRSIMYFKLSNPIDSDNGDYVAPKLDKEVIHFLQGMYGKGSTTNEGAPRRDDQGPTKNEITTTSTTTTTPTTTTTTTTTTPSPSITVLPTTTTATQDEPSHCASHVYAALSFPRHQIMLFPHKGKRVIVFNAGHKKVTLNEPVSSIFSDGPPFVTAAYYSWTGGKFFLFHGNKVWAYDFNTDNEVTLADGYPKRLPVSADWRTGAAMYHGERSTLVNFEGKAVNYFETTNTVEDRGHVSQVYPNMPEAVAGMAMLRHGVFVGFTESEVFQYDYDEETTKDMGRISDFVEC